MSKWEEQARQVIAETVERSHAINQAIADLEREMNIKVSTQGQD